MVNVLYISYDGMTDPLGQSQVLPYLVGLSKKGYQFHLISFEKQENYSFNKKTIQKIVDEASIVWEPLTYTKNPPVFSTLYDVIRMRKRSRQLHKNVAFSIVHCRSYISAFAGLYLKNKFGVKFVFDIRGFWPDERIESGIWNKHSWVYKLVYKYFKKKEEVFFTKADYIISLTYKAKGLINDFSYLNKPSIKVIPTCADLALFSKNSINVAKQVALRNKYKLDVNSVVISYLGSLGNWNLLEEMLDFFKVCLTKYEHVKFLLITQTSHNYIKNEIKRKGLNLQDFILTQSERNHLPTLLSLSNFSVFFVKPIYSQNASAPTKLGELMAMNIPVIVNSGYGDVADIVSESNCGVVINSFDEQAYEKAIDSMDNLQLNSQLDIVSESKTHFSLNVGIERYKEVYTIILE